MPQWHYYGYGQYCNTTTAPYYSGCLSDRSKQRLRTKLRRLAGAIQGVNDDGSPVYQRYG